MRYLIPTKEKAAEIALWCQRMQKKYPKMKPNRISRKAAEYFHLKKA